MNTIPAGLVEALCDWQAKQATAIGAVMAEKEARAKLAVFYGDDANGSGIHYIDLAQGYRLKAVFKINYTVIKEVLPDTLDAIGKHGPSGTFIAERLFRYKPELSVSEYKGLPADYKALADQAITTSPGAPTYEIIAPKGAK